MKKLALSFSTPKGNFVQASTNQLHLTTSEVLFRVKASFLCVHCRHCPLTCCRERSPPTPASRLGSAQAPWRQQLPCVSTWMSWSAAMTWAGAASAAEPPQSCWGCWPPGSWEPAGGHRSRWAVACVCAMECHRCCNRGVPAGCWLLLVVAGRHWWRSCPKLTWGSTGSGSWAGGGLWAVDWWRWRRVCRSWTRRLSQYYSSPMTRASVPEHLPFSRKWKQKEKSKTQWPWPLTPDPQNCISLLSLCDVMPLFSAPALEGGCLTSACWYLMIRTKFEQICLDSASFQWKCRVKKRKKEKHLLFWVYD